MDPQVYKDLLNLFQDLVSDRAVVDLNKGTIVIRTPNASKEAFDLFEPIFENKNVEFSYQRKTFFKQGYLLIKGDVPVIENLAHQLKIIK